MHSYHNYKVREMVRFGPVASVYTYIHTCITLFWSGIIMVLLDQISHFQSHDGHNQTFSHLTGATGPKPQICFKSIDFLLCPIYARRNTVDAFVLESRSAPQDQMIFVFF